MDCRKAAELRKVWVDSFGGMRCTIEEENVVAHAG